MTSIEQRLMVSGTLDTTGIGGGPHAFLEGVSVAFGSKVAPQPVPEGLTSAEVVEHIASEYAEAVGPALPWDDEDDEAGPVDEEPQEAADAAEGEPDTSEAQDAADEPARPARRTAKRAQTKKAADESAATS